MAHTAPRAFLDRRSAPHIATLIAIASLTPAGMNIFLPALPSMAAHFDTSYGVIQLALSIYLGVNAVLQLFIGPLSDRFGRRIVMLCTMAIFIVSTIAAIFAPNVETFLALRAVQAAIVSGTVISRATVRDLYPDDQAASRIAYVTMGMSITPMIAPAVGGFLATVFGWQAIFWFVSLLGTLVFVLYFFDAGETAAKSESNLREIFNGFPELLKARRFLGYALCAALAGGAYFAYLGGSPSVGKSYFGLSEASLGQFMAAPAIGYFIGNFLSGKFSSRIGINRMIVAGGIVACLGLLASLAIALAGASTPYIFFGSVIALGLGNGMQLPNSIAGSLSVRPKLAGTASGLGGAMMISGGAALSAFAGLALPTENGPAPLLMLMITAQIGSLLSIYWVISRARRLGVQN